VNSISSAASLCNALDISLAELQSALALASDQRYTRKAIEKKDGTTRMVHNPHHLIRKIQRRINRRIFSDQSIIKWPDHIFGSIPNDTDKESPSAERDFVNCARQHCGAKSILTVDIKDFFDNIHKDHVEEIFSDFLKYKNEVPEILANICCKDDHVVQGALTSSYIASLCLFSSEGGLVKKLSHKGLTYTRLVDDITVSSKISSYDFGYALRQIEQMLHEAGLPLNAAKTKIQYSSMSPLIVHGLRVDFSQPRLPPDEPRRIRAAVKNLELLAASPGYRASRAYRKDFNRCMGRVNKLGRVEHIQHEKLLPKLQRILPLPSHQDIARAEKLISRLELDSAKPNYKDSYWFYKRFYVANERLGILKRSFPKKSEELRQRLRLIKPNHRYE
jgi:RNA-directed DNA polymerase